MTTPERPPDLRVAYSRLFPAWLDTARVSIVFTAYHINKLFFLGLKPDGGVAFFERSFDRCMGLGVENGQLWMSALSQLWRFENFMEPGETRDGYDALFVPVTGHTTGDLDIHDIHPGGDGPPIFVATRYNCLATLAERGSFKALWHPPFIDRIAAEDRCHLNGMAVEDGQPAYITCLSRSNFTEGWRSERATGGVVLDVRSNEIVAEGLSMPHSPRVYRDRVWMLQSGTGEFGHLDVATGRFEPVCFLPGFARGLAFAGDHAVIGLSRPRATDNFDDLPLMEKLSAQRIGPKCAICVVNLTTGDIEHILEFEGAVQEIYDVAVLPGLRRPRALGFRTDDVRFATKVERGTLQDM